MKLLTLCLSDGVGGLELYAERCIAYYQQHGIENALICRTESFLAQRCQNLTSCYYLPKTRLKSLPLLNAWRIAKIIKRYQPDIVHLHWGNDLPLAVFALHLSGSSAKLIYSRHMAIAHFKHNPYHRWLYQRVNLLLTVTKQLKQEAMDKLPIANQRIRTLYLGVDAPKNPLPRISVFNALGLNPRHFTLLLLGRIETAKGQHVLIDAIKQLAEQHLICQAAIVGKVMDQSYLNQLKQRVADNKLTQQIRWGDYIDQPLDSLPAFDTVVLTTKNETFGLTLVEAMRAGVPVIGSAAGGVLEIIDHQHTGLLFTPDSSKDLAKQIRRYMSDKALRQQCANEGKTKADRHFAAQQHFTSLVQLYQHLIDNTD